MADVIDIKAKFVGNKNIYDLDSFAEASKLGVTVLHPERMNFRDVSYGQDLILVNDSFGIVSDEFLEGEIISVSEYDDLITQYAYVEPIKVGVDPFKDYGKDVTGCMPRFYGFSESFPRGFIDDFTRYSSHRDFFEKGLMDHLGKSLLLDRARKEINADERLVDICFLDYFIWERAIVDCDTESLSFSGRVYHRLTES